MLDKQLKASSDSHALFLSRFLKKLVDKGTFVNSIRFFLDYLCVGSEVSVFLMLSRKVRMPSLLISLSGLLSKNRDTSFNDIMILFL